MSQILDLISKNSFKWAKDNTIYLVSHGSRAYGTHTPTSDFDYKGVCIPPKEYYLSFHKKFEQLELKAPNPDVVIYEIKKFFNLLSQANPSLIEVLFVDSSNIVKITKLGELLLENRDKFLSKKIRHTFGGYAFQTLKRLKLHRNYLLNPPQKEPTRQEYGLPEFTLIPQDQMLAVNSEIEKIVENYNLNFLDKLDEPEQIEAKTTFNQILSELKISSDNMWDLAARKVGCDENFIALMSKEREYKARKKEWDQYQNWKKNRNPARAELEKKFGVDTKFCYHLIRLLRMCKEILDTGKVYVRRPDAEELLYIRNGGWSYDKIMEEASKIELELDISYQQSKLPRQVDINYLDQLCMTMTEFSFKGE